MTEAWTIGGSESTWWRRRRATRYRSSVDHDMYFTVFDGELVELTSSRHLPAGISSILPQHVELFLGQTVLTIGTWPDTPDRPHVLALDAGGDLVSVLAVDESTVEQLPTRLVEIDDWLATLHLRDLRDFSGDPAAFYEGLWDLSPDASMTLSAHRRVVLITALDSIDVTLWPSALASATIEIQYLDVLMAPNGGQPVLTRRPPTPADLRRAESVIAPLAEVIDLGQIEPSSDQPAHAIGFQGDAVSGDQTSMQPPPPPTIDLRETAPNPVSPIDASILTPAPRIRPGATFAIDRLPLLFDPLGANLTSINDELFAVNDHLVLVEKIPERRRETPFEDQSRFRWDTSRAQIELLSTHHVAPHGRTRVLHLFVETERQGEYCVYIGELTRQQSPMATGDDAAWFTITPSIDNDLYRLLRKGKLPEHIESPTIDFGTLDV